MKVFVSYKRDHAESEAVLSLLETELSGVSTRVYSDRLLTAGEWRPKLLEWIDGCDLFVVLLSEKSIESEEVKDEVHRAYDQWVRTGRKKPTIIPVNVHYSGPLGGFRRDLSGFQALRWTGAADNETLLKKIREELARARKPWVYGLVLAALLLVALLAYPFLLPSLRNTLKAREASPGPLPGSTSRLSVRRITDVGNVIAVAVSSDAKTVFVNRFAFDESAGVHVIDVNGAPPRKLFDTFGGTLACGTSNCYFSGAVHREGVYRFSASRAPVMLFSGDFHDIDLSPDGDRRLLTRSGETPNTDLVVRRIDEGSQTVEWSSRNALHDPSWHPDGKSVLYVGPYDAVMHDLATGKQVPLPRPAASIFHAAWERGGRYVLAYTKTLEAGEFWILRPDQQPIGPLLREEVRYANLRTTSLPDTFSAVRRESHTVAHLASLGSKWGTLQIGQRNMRGPFSWAGPEHLVYAAKDGTGTCLEEYHIHSGEVRRLSPTGTFGQPTMTPDGERLVFSMGAGVESDLWTSLTDRWDPVKLAQLPTRGHAISPDSQWVAIAASGPEGGLYVTPVEPGGKARRLTRASVGDVSFATPHTILFRRASDGIRPLCKISREGGPETCFAVDGVGSFAVSPDRKTVAAVEPGKSSRLHFIDIASGAVGKVVTVPRWIDTNGGIAWTAGDSRIVYVTETPSARAVEAYRLADGAIEIVSESSQGFAQHIAVSPDGRYAVFLREWSSGDAVLLTVTP
ncbi:MAG TPA: toll/interleukin-1 receptor domain-containing protein [Thermoanaerobaculia bacterium]|nr:toll/interleukin-1 receptor domain-containing protein [Thermoanaerobaculia bacterium]